eukprot:EG_transcript_55197
MPWLQRWAASVAKSTFTEFGVSILLRCIVSAELEISVLLFPNFTKLPLRAETEAYTGLCFEGNAAGARRDRPLSSPLGCQFGGSVASPLFLPEIPRPRGLPALDLCL